MSIVFYVLFIVDLLQWIGELRRYSPSVPIVLVGTKLGNACSNILVVHESLVSGFASSFDEETCTLEKHLIVFILGSICSIYQTFSLLILKTLSTNFVIGLC